MAYYKNIITYLNQSQIQKRTRGMKLRPNPETIKGQIFPSIYGHTFSLLDFLTCLLLRIYSLACLYNLKANGKQFSKYFEVYMILKDDCTERSLLAIEV
jgi:hypothetical protein